MFKVQKPKNKNNFTFKFMCYFFVILINGEHNKSLINVYVKRPC